VLIRRQQTVASDPVGPLVGYLDLQLVHTRLQRVGHVHAVRWRPHQPFGFAIHLDLGDVANLAEIDPDVLTAMEPGSRRLKGFAVCCGSGEVLDAVNGAVGP
jgi:hypothetical protein